MRKVDFKKTDISYKREYLLPFLAFTIPLGQKASTYVLLLILFLSLVLFKKTEIKPNKNLLLLPLLYILYILSLIYTENFSFKYFEQKASLLALPIIFYSNKKYLNQSRIAFFFILGCLASTVYCLINALYNSFSLVNGGFYFQSRVDQNYSLINSVVNGGNYFFGELFSVLHQSIYFSMFLVLGVGFTLFSKLNINIRYRALITFILSLAVFQSSSRAGIITLIFVILFYTFKTYQKKKRFKIVFTSIVLILITFSISNPRIKNIYKNIITEGFSFHNEDTNSLSMRLMTWHSSLIVISNNPVLGVGIGDAYNSLKEVYASKRYVKPYKEELNAHNQYLQIYIEVGVLGTILYLLTIFRLNKIRFKDYQISHFNLVFISIIIINSFFESILNHYSGIVFYSFFYSFFVMINREKTMIK